MNDTSLVQQHPVKPEVPQFTTVGRGFHPREVDDFLHRVFAYVGHLEHQLAQRTGHLAGDGLHFAESPQGHQEILDLMRFAVLEIEGNQAAAAQEVAQMLADARAQAQQITSQAQQEATAMQSGARQQAETVLSGARAEAKRMTDKAAAESAAVTEGAGRRMEALTGMHEETIRRLEQIHDVVGNTLTAEEERGTLEDEKKRALAATSVVAASAPAQLTASS